METTETIQPTSTGLRPTFLTVLCILTFIGSGLGLIGGIYSFALAGTTAAVSGQILDQAKDQVSEQPNSDFASKLLGSIGSGLSAENIRKSSTIKIISCLFTLLGGIMMWQLKKSGFYSYILGIAIGVFGPLLALGGIMGWGSSFGMGFFGLLFIILYGVNLKHLTR